MVRKRRYDRCSAWLAQSRQGIEVLPTFFDLESQERKAC